MANRSGLPPALRSEDFALPHWMEFGFQQERVPDEYWKYFPERFPHRFAFADWIERHRVADHIPFHLAPLLRRYLIEQGVVAPNQRLRRGVEPTPDAQRRRTASRRSSEAYRKACLYFGDDFMDRFYNDRIPRNKQGWADKIRAHRAPYEFAQPDELGNVWPEALIAQVQLDFHFKSYVFEEHRMTPEKQAEEDYHNALSDAEWYNEHIDKFVAYLRNSVRRRELAPLKIVKNWLLAPKSEGGMGYEHKPYDHSLMKKPPELLGPRTWHFLSSFQDSKTRKHTLIKRDELIKRLDDERPAPPELPDHLKQSPEAPVIFDEDGTVIPVRFDAERDCWVDDFGDPVSVEKNDE